jgi:hypothetical protein
VKETTAPIVGDNILAVFRDTFCEKYREKNGQIKGIKIWPAAAVEETFRKAAGETGGANEAQAMKTFYTEMVRFLRTGTYIDFDPEEDEIMLTLLEGEPLKTKEAPHMEFTEPPRIANRSDALDLLNDMLALIKGINAGSPPGFQGKEKAIGSIAYYWPRLEALRDAVEREII